MGPDRNDEKQFKVLNGAITWQYCGTSGFMINEAGPRQSETFIKEFDLEGAKRLSSLTVKLDEGKCAEMFNAVNSTRYKSLVARANHLVADRPDIQVACCELSTAMATPRDSDWERLRGGSLTGRRRLVHRCAKFTRSITVTTFTDANWASDRKSWTSLSGGCVTFGSHWLHVWCEFHIS